MGVRIKFNLLSTERHVSFTMSLAPNVIVLKPVKGSELMKSPTETPDIVGKYVPPSKRGEMPVVKKDLTMEQINSEVMFPSLSSANHTTKGISWGTLRSRLETTEIVTKPLKQTIEESIKRTQAEREEALSREAITDPLLMTREKAEREGWTTLHLNYRDPKNWFRRSGYNKEPMKEDLFAWPRFSC